MKYLLPFLCLLCVGWSWSWETKTDIDGYPTGCYATTPTPITEASSSYSITNDEGGKTFTLGTLFFVDGAAADDTGSGTEFVSPKKYLESVIDMLAAPTNATILVRGAHDAFDGVYVATNSYSFTDLSGVDDTHRLMVVGYGQERPIFDADGEDFNIFYCGFNAVTNAFITWQRMTCRNSQATGWRWGMDGSTDADKRAQYLAVIDCYGTNLTADPSVDNGSIYCLNADHALIRHCTFENAGGHGLKFGDGASYGVVEWNSVYNAGQWGLRAAFTSRAVGIDFPSDAGDRTATNVVVRYNYVTNCVGHGMQLRECLDFDVHHNEVTGWARGKQMAGDWSGVTPYGAVIGFGTQISGSFYGNIFHGADSGNTNAPVFAIQGNSTTSSNFVLTVYNNLVYDVTVTGNNSLISSLNSKVQLRVYNNTLIQSNDATVVVIRAGTFTNDLVNNVIWQQGTGAIGDKLFHSENVIGHRYNLYYYPSGTYADWGADSAGGITNNPDLGPTYYPLVASPARDAATIVSGFSVDANNVVRGGSWDIGAYEFSTATNRVNFMQVTSSLWGSP